MKDCSETVIANQTPHTNQADYIDRHHGVLFVLSGEKLRLEQHIFMPQSYHWQSAVGY
jgi:hypothetical protein